MGSTATQRGPSTIGGGIVKKTGGGLQKKKGGGGVKKVRKLRKGKLVEMVRLHKIITRNYHALKDAFCGG